MRSPSEWNFILRIMLDMSTMSLEPEMKACTARAQVVVTSWGRCRERGQTRGCEWLVSVKVIATGVGVCMRLVFRVRTAISATTMSGVGQRVTRAKLCLEGITRLDDAHSLARLEGLVVDEPCTEEEHGCQDAACEGSRSAGSHPLHARAPPRMCGHESNDARANVSI